MLLAPPPSLPLQALTEYHFVLLYGSKLQYVNRVSKRVVQEVPLDRSAVSTPPVSGELLECLLCLPHHLLSSGSLFAAD